MLIQIVRAARLALFDTEVQSLRPGEIYTVSPAVGQVLVGEGWACEVATSMALEPDRADDDPGADISDS